MYLGPSNQPGFETGSQTPIPGVSNASGSGLPLKAEADRSLWVEHFWGTVHDSST